MLFDDFPLPHLSTRLDLVVFCPENPDKNFIALFKMRGDVIRGERGHCDVASINNIPVIDPQGDQYEQTQGGCSNCALVCKPYPQ